MANPSSDHLTELIATLRQQLEPFNTDPEPPRGFIGKWLHALDKKPMVHWRAYGVVLSNRSLETHRGSSLPVVTPHAEALEAAFELIAKAMREYPQFVRRRVFGRIAAALNDQPDASQGDCIELCLTVLEAVLREDYPDP